LKAIDEKRKERGGAWRRKRITRDLTREGGCVQKYKV
jgi:hypothetical protein